MKKVIIDGNEAVARASYKLSENAFVYPITPSSSMAENFDKWSCNDEKNIFDQKVEVTEMQSEGGVAGALHGSALSGSLATTFTSSQGLLLMLPNMYKIAGEMLPTVIHVASRSVASHALNIFCDHSDVMSVRETGFCMLASSNPQEAYDFAVASHITTLKTNLPFLHFFDGFRTSHQLCGVKIFEDDELKTMYPYDALEKYKTNSLTPNNPFQYGTNENSDIFFQGREKSNLQYKDLPKQLENTFELLKQKGANKHHIMEYYGSKDAKYVVCVMASAFDTLKKYIDWANDVSMGVVKINLYRPFDGDYFLNLLPNSVQKIAVLDRTKEQGSLGEPLYLDICTSVAESGKNIKVYGGRFGLGGKEFAPNHAKAVFDNLKSAQTKNHFTVGIDDDLSNTSLIADENFEIVDDCYNALFCGLGSDGSVSASKNITKIVGENTDKNVQSFFMYDSKKSGGLTRSYLNFSNKNIDMPYVAKQNNVIVVNNTTFLEKFDFAKMLKNKGIFLINSNFKTTDDLTNNLPNNLKISLAQKDAKVFSVDANKIATENNISGKISTIMQMAFFEITNILDKKIAQEKTVENIKKIFAKKGENVVKNNIDAIKNLHERIIEIKIDENWKNLKYITPLANNNPYIDEYLTPVLNLNGDKVPVSKVNLCGKNQVGTTGFEKQNISNLLPKWNSEKCIQCGKCSFICPHSVIRSKAIKKCDLENKPSSLDLVDCKYEKDCYFTMQISAEHCTGCTLCSKVCPTKAIQMVGKESIFEKEKTNFEYLNQKENIVPIIPNSIIKTQFLKPYFEYSGACAGCGETPYIRLLTQLFGNSLIIANATGCSSIYGGTAPTCPYLKDKNNQGVAWANSLFEDNAEFGFGILKSKQQQRNSFRDYVLNNFEKFDIKLQILLEKWLKNYENYEICNEIYLELSTQKDQYNSKESNYLFKNIDNITKKIVWIVGGDGWAYDIDFGGIDHILSTGENVKILILDTEVYSNTGGQASKSTPKNAITTLSNNGKQTTKKRLALNALAYKNVYIAQICLGADMTQTLNAFLEAQNYNGPSVIIAYAPCINHGLDMKNNIKTQNDAVKSGYWSLFRYDPERIFENKNPMSIDSKIETSAEEFLMSQRRFANFAEKTTEKQLIDTTQKDNLEFYNLLEKIKNSFDK